MSEKEREGIQKIDKLEENINSSLWENKLHTIEEEISSLKNNYEANGSSEIKSCKECEEKI